ncbi:hypothetical protein UF75_5220 [Desulfosporosinus sp. I2]|nr:hypothetical protein UF75_5220 [Desulfosporosinus sp. I2]
MVKIVCLVVYSFSLCVRVIDDEKFGNMIKGLLVGVVYERLRQDRL